MTTTARVDVWATMITGHGRVDPRTLTPHPHNPRRHPAAQDAALTGSLEELGWIDEITVNETTGHITDGHERHALALAHGVAEVPVRYVRLTEAQERKALLIKDPIAAMATYDSADLAALLAGVDTDSDGLRALLDLLAAPPLDADPPAPSAPRATLADRFVVPPFSVLDARQGYWQERKRAWLAYGIQSELGRGEHTTPTGDYHAGPARTYGQDLMRGEHVVGGDARAIKDHAWLAAKGKGRPQAGLTWVGGDRAYDALDPVSQKILDAQPQSGTSIFDPVLCELAYRWFSPPGGRVLDPFAGGSVRGIIAALLGRTYTGIDLSPAQVGANRTQATSILGVVHGGAPAQADAGGSSPPHSTITLAALLATCHPITVADLPTLRAATAGYLSTTGRLPRYYLSPLQLVAHPGTFFLGALGGCTIVLKRSRIMRTPILYLLLPPLSPTGDTAAEAAVLATCRALGIGARLAAHDLALYGLAPTAAGVARDGDNVEYVYRAGDYTALAGAAWKTWRAQRNQAAALAAAGAFHDTTYAGPYTAPDALAARALADRWCTLRGKSRDQVRFIGVADPVGHADPAAMTTHTLHDAHGALVASSVVERVGAGAGTITLRLRDYANTVIADPTLLLHLGDMQRFARAEGDDGLLNIGAPVRGGAGLAAAKLKLRPAHRMQIYTVAPTTPLTLDAWAAAAPAPARPARAPIAATPAPAWIVGDARAVATLAPGTYDLLFTCPPYADLEVYSDDPRDLSTLAYPAFVAAYRAIIAAACALLAPHRFAVIVVGDVRDPRGYYRSFIADTIAAFADAGLGLYNEAILVTAAGSLPLRTGKQFSATRKLGKTHQQVLVFCNGDPRLATAACGTVEVEVPAEAGGDDPG